MMADAALADDFGHWMNVAEQQESAKDDDATPMFYMRAVQNAHKTGIEGRPVFDERPFVKILVPGDNKNMPDREVREEDRQRWPRQWAEFLQRRESAPQGTPLEECPLFNVTEIAELKLLNVLTVEQYANLGDSGLERAGMGARAKQTRIRQWLQPQSDTETELRRENAGLEQQVSDLNNKVETLMEKLAEAGADNNPPKRRRPGRPRKNQVDDDASDSLPDSA